MKCFKRKKGKDKPRTRVIHAPVKNPRVQKGEVPVQWLEDALAITSQFEGSGYGNVSGNFDGQGLSCGCLQWNYGQGSLQSKILTPFILMHGTEALDSFFPSQVSHSSSMSRKAGIKFSLKMQNKMFSWKRRKNYYLVKPEWKKAWRNFLSDPRTIKIQIMAAESIASKAYSYCQKYNSVNKRTFLFCFDVVVQNGGFKGVPKPELSFNDLDQYPNFIKRYHLASESNRDDWFKSFNESGKESLLMASLFHWIDKRVTLNKWASDVISRKGTLIHGIGKVHGKHFQMSVFFDEKINKVLN